MEAHDKWGIHGGFGIQGTTCCLYALTIKKNHLEDFGSSEGEVFCMACHPK